MTMRKPFLSTTCPMLTVASNLDIQRLFFLLVKVLHALAKAMRKRNSNILSAKRKTKVIVLAPLLRCPESWIDLVEGTCVSPLPPCVFSGALCSVEGVWLLLSMLAYARNRNHLQRDQEDAFRHV